MSILCWNCRGLGNPSAIQDLRELINKEDLMLVFLSKTMLRASSTLRTKEQFVFAFDFTIVRRSGGYWSCDGNWRWMLIFKVTLVVKLMCRLCRGWQEVVAM